MYLFESMIDQHFPLGSHTKLPIILYIYYLYIYFHFYNKNSLFSERDADS